MLIAAQRATGPVLERLDPPRRAAVVMALLALTLIGVFLITFVMIGGHWVRRLARHRPGQHRRSSNETSSNRALNESLQSFFPEMKTDDTVLLDTPSKDTKAGM
jgi:hypothetical protein